MARLCPPTPQLLHEASQQPRMPLGLGLGHAELRAVPALQAVAVSLKHPAISKGLSVAAFPVLFHFLATSYTAGQLKCLCFPMAGDVGNAWVLSVGAGEHLELRAGSFLACGTACLVHCICIISPTVHRPGSWMGFPGQIVRGNCSSGPLPTWAASSSAPALARPTPGAMSLGDSRAAGKVAGPRRWT